MTEETELMVYSFLLGVWTTCIIIGVGVIVWALRERKKFYREYTERRKRES